jgi:hypothetical protein
MSAFNVAVSIYNAGQVAIWTNRKIQTQMNEILIINHNFFKKIGERDENGTG